MRTLFILLIIFSGCLVTHSQPSPLHDLRFARLAQTWDEGLPLGNGQVGALVWQQQNNLRMSLDRSDLWDLRPTPGLSDRNWQWVIAQWKQGNYKAVQQWGDEPYEAFPAPTKLPGAGLHFETASFGAVESVHLRLEEGLASVKWQNGTRFSTFVHAEKAIGWFRFEGLPTNHFMPMLSPPTYQRDTNRSSSNSVEGSGLETLKYPQGGVARTSQSQLYVQKGWGGFSYHVSVRWQQTGRVLVGVWSISAHYPDQAATTSAENRTQTALRQGWHRALATHRLWWKDFWSRSRIRLPDETIERQYYRDLYKFGSVARADTPPISLQSVWTADNGKLPPWKGDFHHDLNTQLSYWPGYTANRTDLTAGFTHWLWNHRGTFQKWTKAYFGTDGLNVPGVTTLRGEPMGGWIQYSLSPTMGAWTAHHFYLQWRYTMDKTFLKTQAYPFVKAVAKHLSQIAVQKNGNRQLPLSSSPEIHDNAPEAWFEETTNFDLALIRWTFSAAIQMAEALNLSEEKAQWVAEIKQWPDLHTSETDGLMVAPGHRLAGSHRHFSHLMAIHPLGMYQWRSEKDRMVIASSLHNLEKNGTDWWTGYSFAWQASLYARARKGDQAAKALRIFATCFVLPNSFHANGTQCKGQHSKFEYRPFTLEGNFASAAGVQEMLLQSHLNTIEVFPAIPASWETVSFQQLRTDGAFLVSAALQDGKLTHLRIQALAGGTVRVYLPTSVLTDALRHAGFGENAFMEKDFKLGEVYEWKVSE